MSQNESFKKYLKHAIAYFAWFCVLLSTHMPAPGYADLCLTSDDELNTRTKVAYVVAGLTVIGLVAGIVCLSRSSGHHKHHTRSSAMSSIDNYRAYSYSSHSHSDYYSSDYSSDYSDYSDYSSDYSHESSDHHHHHSHHHSGYYSSNPYSIFSANDVSSFSDRSSNRRLDRPLAGRTCHAARSKRPGQEESSLSGQFISHPAISSGSSENLTAFVQLPDGTSKTLGTLSGNSSLSYGPFHQKGAYTFGVSLDQGNALPSQVKMGSIQIEVNGSPVQCQDFMAPPHAPERYEPSPCCFELT